MTLVLIVEDNAVNRDVLGRRLKRRGYDIRFAYDGAGGIAATKEFRPDVVLMDLGLGEMTGFEATRRIKADPEISQIPIIALTASRFKPDREKSLIAGCCDFETKPVDLPRLITKIERATDQASNGLSSPGSTEMPQ